MRVATVTVGAAALATAGVVAYNLPAPAPRKVVARTVVTPATTQPAAPAVRYWGDDGGDGRTRTTAPAGSTSKTTSHTTSGGS